MHRIDFTLHGETYSVSTDAGAEDAIALMLMVQANVRQQVARSMLVQMGEACNAMCAATKVLERELDDGEDEDE